MEQKSFSFNKFSFQFYLFDAKGTKNLYVYYQCTLFKIYMY